MAQVNLTTEQMEELQRRVGKLFDDKAAADEATEEASAARLALQVAQAEVVMKDAAEAELDGVVTTDVVELQDFIGTLITPPSAKAKS